MNLKNLSILIIIAVAATFGWFYFGKQPNPNGKNMACTQEALLCPDGSAVGRTGPNCQFALCPKAQNTKNVSVDPLTKDWKVYKNSKYNFSLKYPKEWRASGKPVTPTFSSFIDEPGSAANPDTVELDIKVISGEKVYTSAKQYLDAQDSLDEVAPNGKPAYEVRSEVSKTISGLKAIEREIYLNTTGFPVLETYFFKDGIIYEVSMNLYIGEIVLGRKNLYDRIINTFDFL